MFSTCAWIATLLVHSTYAMEDNSTPLRAKSELTSMSKDEKTTQLIENELLSGMSQDTLDIVIDFLDTDAKSLFNLLSTDKAFYKMLKKIFAKMPIFLSSYRGGNIVTLQNHIVPETWSFTLQFPHLQSSGEIFNNLASNTFQHEDTKLVYSHEFKKLLLGYIAPHRPGYYTPKMITDTNGNVDWVNVHDETTVIDPRSQFHFDGRTGILTVRGPSKRTSITRSNSEDVNIDIDNNGKVTWKDHPDVFFQIQRLSLTPQKVQDMEKIKDIDQKTLQKYQKYHGKIFVIGFQMMEFKLSTKQSEDDVTTSAVGLLGSRFDPESFQELRFVSDLKADLTYFKKNDENSDAITF